MTDALSHVAWEPCLVEPSPDKVLEAHVRKKLGISHPSIRYFTPVPWLARALVDMRPEFGLLVHVDLSVSDLVALVVSQGNSCRFCYAAVRALLWGHGMSMARIQRLEQDLSRAELPPRTAAAIAFGRSQSRSAPQQARQARDALLRAGFNDDEMKEIAYTVAETDFSNRAHTIPAIPAHLVERIPRQFLMQLARPLLKRILDSHCFRGQATAMAPVSSHPYSCLVRIYAGSPIALAMSNALEGMWVSPHLSRRCKLLMLAVIARGLTCQAFTLEVEEALEHEGLTEAAFNQVLTHLNSSELDPVERLLVPFARETIWYEPKSVQRRAQALRDHLSVPQLLEAIGVAAMANALCRLGATVIDDP